MSLYTSLNVSPSKKRVCSSSDEEPTPKRRRIPSPTPRPVHESSCPLPRHLSRLNNLHSALQRALSIAVASCRVSPSEGKIPNLLNLTTIANFSEFRTTSFTEDDLKRICWIWEWDSASLPPPATHSATEDDLNPFVVSTAPSPSKGGKWTRGSMGCIISPTYRYSESAQKRIPAYGIGIEVELDIDKGMTSGMAAVARWATGTENRRAKFQAKLEYWTNLHSDSDGTDTPDVPFAQLPPLVVRTAKPSSLTRAFASSSPKGATVIENTISAPSSPAKSPPRSQSSAPYQPNVPFPTAKARASTISPSKPRTSESIPSTPSSRLKRTHPLAGLLTPKAHKRLETEGPDSLPTTPVRQRGSDAQTAPSPSTSRRQALYDRARLKSLSATPAKPKRAELPGGTLTMEQLRQMSEEEIHRRASLGRSKRIANMLWMLFSPSVGPTGIPTRRRKALPAEDVVAAVVNSASQSGIAISGEEASESLQLLTELCPFFLRNIVINGEKWLEMPSSAASSSDITEGSLKTIHNSRSPTKSGSNLGPSRSLGPSAHPDTTELLLTPRKQPATGLQRVHEKITRELAFPG